MADPYVAALSIALAISGVATSATPTGSVPRGQNRPTVRAVAQATEVLPAPREETADDVLENEEVPSSPAPDVRWRYRYHLSRWWYFVEPGHWLFWDGHCWQDAQPMLPKQMPDGSVRKVGIARRALAAWPQVPSYHEHHGWIGGFYSSGGGYGSSDFGYGYGIPSYGPGRPD